MKKISKNDTENIVSLMFSLGRNIRDHSSREETPNNPSMIKLEIMKLVSQGNVNMKDVSDYLCIKAPTATAFVDDLVKSKILTRESDLHDRRNIKLLLSEIGKKILKSKYSERGKSFREVLAKLSEDEIKNFEKLLVKLQALYKEKNNYEKNI